MITGYATVDNAVAALRYGVDDYLTKPFDIQDLRQTVARALRNRKLRERNADALSNLQRANTELRSLKDMLQHEVVSARQDLREAYSLLQKRRQELDTLSGVGQTLARTLDLDELLDNCLELVVSEMGVEKASIMLLEPRREGPTPALPAFAGPEGELVVKASIGPSAVDIVGERERLGEGIAGWVAREGEPLLIKDVNQAPQFRRGGKGPGQRTYKNVSLICVPLIAKGRVLGVINANDKANGQSFGRGDVSLLSTIAGQIAVTIENARLYEQLQTSAFRTVQALVVTLEAKDAYTSGHSQRVTDYATRIGRNLILPEHDLHVLRYASQLHDIGKIGITEDILHKPGPLDDTEWQVVRSHPVISERIIQPLDFLEEVKQVVRNHHERWDGAGYPDGLHGEGIPLLTRILCVADAYDAMTSRRPYRLRPFTPQQAVGELHLCEGSQFDPQVIQTLRDCGLFAGPEPVA
jgi:response regulator RpfG family c-di-GMP phosphodiesterase